MKLNNLLDFLKEIYYFSLGFFHLSIGESKNFSKLDEPAIGIPLVPFIFSSSPVSRVFMVPVVPSFTTSKDRNKPVFSG